MYLTRVHFEYCDSVLKKECRWFGPWLGPDGLCLCTANSSLSIIFFLSSKVGPGRPHGLPELPNFKHVWHFIEELSANCSQTIITIEDWSKCYWFAVIKFRVQKYLFIKTLKSHYDLLHKFMNTKKLPVRLIDYRIVIFPPKSPLKMSKNSY